MFFRQIFDPDLAQYAYLIGCQRTGEAIIIDPERDIDRYLAIAEEEELRIVAATETHIHADFLSGVRELAQMPDVTVYLSDEGDADWKYGWVTGDEPNVRLLHDGDVFRVGNIRIEALHTPGHTPEHLSFLVTDLGGGAAEPMGIASGDFVFVGDLGRPDLLESAAGVVGAREPSARRLFASTKRFLELADHIQVWPGHGAGSACGKALGAVPQSTVGYERRFNTALSFDEEGRFVNAILEGQPEPPLYFARMKRLNRDGVPLLGSLPRPERVSAAEARRAAPSRPGHEGPVVVDTRASRADFARGHLPGSLHAPLGIRFPQVVGSYVEPDQEIYLVVEEGEVEAAVRALVRIGYDLVRGFVTPTDLERSEGLTTLARIEMNELDPGEPGEGPLVLDVRGAAEFAGVHVPGATNVAHTRLANHLEELPRDREILVYCRSGARASAAASYLRREGFDATLVDGEFSDWVAGSEATVPVGGD